MTGLRHRIATLMPGFVRKALRKAEHYVRRHVEWFHVLREMRGADGRNQRRLLASAALAPFTALRHLDGFEPPQLLGDTELTVKGIGRFSVRAGTDDIIHLLSAREPAVRAEIEARLRPGDTFVDAGANIGFYSILAARLVGPTGRVIAVEMMPSTAARLRRHAALNNANIRVIEDALSHRDGDTIVATSSPEKFGQASIVVGGDDPARTIRHEVTTVRLDTALADVGDIALLKMDLEGAEFMALSGAPAVLQRTRALLFESNTHDESLFAMLREGGFSVTPLGGRDYLAVSAVEAG